MAIARVVLLALVQTPAVDVRMGGDDGLTQRFTYLLRNATLHLQSSDGRPRLGALVEQLTLKRNGNIRIVVTFDRDGKRIGTSRCTTSEDNLAQCVTRASRAAERLISNVLSGR